MFDNTKPNAIILSDYTDDYVMIKTAGPYAVATALRNAGIETAVIHHLSGFSVSEIKHMLSNLVSDQTLFVGVNNFFYKNIGSDSYEIGTVLPHGKRFNSEIKELIKNKNAECKLILGGPGSTDIAENSDFNYLLVGYSDMSIVNFAQHLIDKKVPLLKSYKSILGPVIVNDSKAEGFDFVNSQIVYEDHDGIMPGETLTIEISRGCIFQCAFCSYPLNGKKKLDFIKSKENLINEFTCNYEKYKVTRYVFSDDTVNDSPEKCKMLYEISKELPFKLEWWGYIRLDLMTAHPETVDWLFDSGLRSASFGIETLNAKTGAAIGKGGSRNKMFTTLKYIKDKYGDSVELASGFIFGLPHEDMDSMKNTINFLVNGDHCLDTWIFNPLMIRSSTGSYTNDFLSEVDRNPKKYGYTDLGDGSLSYDRRTRVGGDSMNWKNQYTTREEVVELCNAANTMQTAKTTGDPVIKGLTAFFLSSYGIPLDLLLCKPHKKEQTMLLNARKQSRLKEYKNILYKTMNIAPYPNQSHEKSRMFTDWRDQHSLN